MLMIAVCGAVFAGCGAVSEDISFEGMAQQIATIPVDAAVRDAAAQQPRTVAEAGLRPSLDVEVLDVHDFWDARDGLPVATSTLRQVAEAVPADTARAATAGALDGLRGALPLSETPPKTVAAPPVVTRLIQLGAYSSETAARAAWTAAAARANGALDGLEPRLEAVQVGGRTLIRLRVAAPEADAPALCRAAQVTDPFCSSTGAA